MIEQTSDKLSLIEIVYIVYIAALYFVRGIGGYEGQVLFNATLVLAMLLFGIKVLITKYTTAEYLIMAALMLLGGVIYYKTGEKWFLLNMTMLLGIKNVNVKKVLNIVFWILATIFVIGFILCLTGIITPECMLHPKNGIGYIICYGMIYPHPNSFHSMFLLITALIIYKVGKCKGTKLIAETIILLLANLYVFLYSFSYTGFGATTLLILLNVYFQRRKNISKAESIVIEAIFPLCVLFSLIGPVTITGRAFDIINKLLSTRYNLSRYFLTQQPITLFGTRFEVPNYTYNIDCSYVYLFMQMGIIAFTIGFAGYIILIHYLLKKNMRIELAITLSFCIAGIAEPFLFNSSFKNITLMFMGIALFELTNKVFDHQILSKNVQIIKPEKIRIFGKVSWLSEASNKNNCHHEKNISPKKNISKRKNNRIIIISVMVGIIISILYIACTDNLNGVYVSDDINQTTSDAPIEYITEVEVAEYRNEGYEIIGYTSYSDPLYGYFGITGTIEYSRRVISLFTWSTVAILGIQYLIQSLRIRYGFSKR